ncbi:putative Transmembrane protease serine 11G [Hypsibius exemplaris]|uniref:Transmembrane protease serine 11G n=1 Tax=Hypsibius exemplaris TaxID=2072580 RepID=A0A1W0WSG2_HYPEX|nr:putative Transmembrane protease serine 11G [Hypsibius exemplaris]
MYLPGTIGISPSIRSSFIWILLTWNIAGHHAQRARLISSCKTALGPGRCTESEDMCQSFGGIIADPISFPSLPKEDSACERGQDCCVLLPLPAEDSCLTCGMTGLTDVQTAGNEVPRRVMPNFEAPLWQPRALDVNFDGSSDGNLAVEDDIEGFIARLSKISKPNKWCWQVALTDRNGTIFGSGALLDGRNVVTLAHKVAERRPEDILLVLGASDFLRPVDRADDAIWFTAPTHIVVHHDFNALTYANDIAILRIPLAPCNQKNICPVCINDIPVGSAPSIDRLNNCSITGWGPLSAAGFPTGIRETPVKVVDNAVCQKNLRDIGVVGFTVPDSLFCTSSINEIKTTNTRACESDGGAPIVCLDNDERWYLRGLITLGVDACSFESSSPLLMTDVGMFFNWIKIQVRAPSQPSSNVKRVANKALIRADHVSTTDTLATSNGNGASASQMRSLDVADVRTRTLSDNWHPLQPFASANP